MPAASPLDGVRDEPRVLQHLAQVPPDQVLQGLGRNVAGRAAPTGHEQAQLGLRATQMVIKGWWQPPTGAAALTAPAADQSAQQIQVHLIVLCRHLTIIHQPLGSGVKLLPWEDHGDGRHSNPFCRVPDAACSIPTANWSQRTAAGLCRAHVHPVGKDLTRIGGIGQQAAQRRRAPDGAPVWRCDAETGQPLDHGRDGGSVDVLGEDLAHDGGLGIVNTYSSWIARVIRFETEVKGSLGPGQQRSSFEPEQPPPAHPLRDQRALVLGHSSADLQQVLIARVVAHRSVEEFDGGAMLLELLDQQYLMDVVAGQTIGRGDQKAAEVGAGGGIAQGIEPRPLETGAAVPFVPEDVLRGQIRALRPSIGS